MTLGLIYISYIYCFLQDIVLFRNEDVYLLDTLKVSTHISQFFCRKKNGKYLRMCLLIRA